MTGYISTIKPKIAAVVGTRPDVIKLAQLCKILDQDPAFHFFAINTYQHSKIVLDQIKTFFGMNGSSLALNVMKEAQTLNDITVKVVDGVDQILKAEKPDLLIVQGDTTSAFAGALAAFHRNIPVAHVEAGIRTRDIHNPWPEEINRMFIDRMATLHFPPTQLGIYYLKDEEIKVDDSFVTGNTSVDALMWCCGKIIESAFFPSRTLYDSFEHVMVTVHRRESFGQPLENICQAVAQIAIENHNIRFIWPVHPNPNVYPVVNRMLCDISNVTLCSHLDYMTSVFLIGTALMVITDSGGVQEEAASFAVPTVVVRERTDRMEHEEWLTSGSKDKMLAAIDEYKDRVKIAGTDYNRIIDSAGLVLKEAHKRYDVMDRSIQSIFTSIRPMYGDGLASERIAAHLRRYFGLDPELFPDPSNFI